MCKFGLKLWSTNDNYVKATLHLYDESVFDYIELYAVPGSYDKYAKLWSDIDIPFIIHAPHWSHGVNIAKKQNKARNLKLIAEAQRFADRLKSEYIILHPGFDGEIEEAIEQIKGINDKRILIENKPYYSLIKGLLCHGITPKEIEYIIEETKAGFCLDIGHAVYSANARKVDYFKDLAEYVFLKPKVCHFSDGNVNDVYDKHFHFGEGNFKIENILKLLPDNILITIETSKKSKVELQDFKKDVFRLKKIIFVMNNHQ